MDEKEAWLNIGVSRRVVVIVIVSILLIDKEEEEEESEKKIPVVESNPLSSDKK